MLPVLSATKLIERLEAERAFCEKPALAFDADGTLWTGDIGIELFVELVAHRAVRKEAFDALSRLAESFGIAKADDPNEQAGLLYEAFLDERLPDDLSFAMMAWAYAGFDTDELDSFVGSRLAEACLESRMQAELSPVLRWAQKEELPVYIVSASPRAVIVKATAKLGIPASHVVAMTPAIAEGRVQPYVEEPIPYGIGKVAALEKATTLVELLGAFGDSGFDLPMLAKAKVPVAVRPKASLLARAHELSELITLRP